METYKVSDLKKMLLEYNITDNDIIKTGESKTKPIKADYIRALEKVKEKEMNLDLYLDELKDVTPNIMMNMDPIKSRAINRSYYKQTPIKDLIYNFVIKHFNYFEQKNMKDYFKTFELFKQYQYEQINQLDDQMVSFLTYYMYLINRDCVEQMDNETMRPTKTIGFLFYNNQILIVTNDSNANGKLKLNINPLSIKQRDTIYVAIIDFFPRDEYNRLAKYNEANNLQSYEQFKSYQYHMLRHMDSDMIQFLKYYIKLIKMNKLQFSSYQQFEGFNVNGFIFLNDRLVAFNYQ